ncbi:MAG: 2-succinyl-6-hydroxy-2,4-cyclohexadiene-1-carboxylate synthase [Anaerolineae bacterium]|nr:2-succinyl-6-hydroxy-2,4-cyclohexadiene-1-carboxylate synthase [Anaerolineae bacterium]
MNICVNDIHYYLEIEGEGEPLLLLHGFTGSVRSWDEIRALLKTQFRLIAVDLLGHGQSTLPSSADRCAMPAACDDLRALLAALGLASAHVLGYSMGGRLALGFALLHPHCVRSLTVISGSPGLATEAERAARRASDDALAQRIERNGIAAFVAEWEKLPLWRGQTLSENAAAKLRAERMRNQPSGLAHSLRGMGTGAQPSFWHRLGELAMPVLWLAGERDAKFVEIAQQMHTALPASRCIIAANAGHALHLEQPQWVADSVMLITAEAQRRGVEI